LGPRSSAG